jgi:hypothetical protein
MTFEWNDFSFVMITSNMESPMQVKLLTPAQSELLVLEPIPQVKVNKKFPSMFRMSSLAPYLPVPFGHPDLL